jgi:hypothetical protein
MAAGDGRHNRQAKPRATGAAAAVSTSEALEGPPQEIGREARARVDHVKFHLPPVWPRADANRSRAVVQGVLNQVPERLFQASRVRLEVQLGGPARR